MPDNIRRNGRFLYTGAILYLLFLLGALPLLYGFGRDGGRGLCRVVLLNISCGSGDGTPSLATTDANGDCAKRYTQ